MRLRSFAIIVTAVMGCSLALTQPASADTIHVHEGQSIQHAVDIANPGDTIIVGHGVFNESVAITKNDITLIGSGASESGTVIEPADVPDGVCSTDEEQNGICVFGNFQTGDFVDGVVIRGFLVQNFSTFGIFGILSSNHVISNNVAQDNGAYGIACFTCTGGTYNSNTVSGSEEAGLYQGDSPEANSTATNNVSFGNGFGFFFRDAANGTATGNVSHDNCVGMMFLDTAGPTQVGSWDVYDNDIYHNNRACPAGEEGPAFSGIGVLITGGDSISIHDNTITKNHHTGDSALRGGVVVWSAGAFGGGDPTNNSIVDNIIRGNSPWDIHWNEKGTGNTFSGNDCRRSKPVGLC
jgi:parallel beta-helix repeat protein